MRNPHITWYARLPVKPAAKLDAWRFEHEMSQSEAIIALALRAGIIEEDDLEQVVTRKVEIPASALG